MTKDFAIHHLTTENAVKIKTIAEMFGWDYHTEFTEFTIEGTNFFNCLYFGVSEWNGKEYRFALSDVNDDEISPKDNIEIYSINDFDDNELANFLWTRGPRPTHSVNSITHEMFQEIL